MPEFEDKGQEPLPAAILILSCPLAAREKKCFQQKIRQNHRFEMIVDCEAMAYENVRSSLNLRCSDCSHNLLMLLIKLKRASLATRNWMLFAQ
jgi:hypothetical protein